MKNQITTCFTCDRRDRSLKRGLEVLKAGDRESHNFLLCYKCVAAVLVALQKKKDCAELMLLQKRCGSPLAVRLC